MKKLFDVVVVVVSVVLIFGTLSTLIIKDIKDDKAIISTSTQYRVIVEDGNFAVLDTEHSKTYADLVENTFYEAESGDVVKISTTTYKSGRTEKSQTIVGSYTEGDLSIYSNCGLAYATYIDEEGTAHNFNLWAIL